MKKNQKLNRFFATVLSVVVLVSSNFPLMLITSFAEETVSVKNSINSSDDNISFTIDEMGHFAIKDNNTGKTWYSISPEFENDTISKGLTKTGTRSELLIEYLYRSEENTSATSQKSNSYAMCETTENIKVSKIEDGYRVVYYFEEIDITIPVEYKIVDSSLEASVDIGGINEGKECYLVTLEFLPYFGAVGPDTEGYLFVPDGCGAVAKFNQNIKPEKAYEKRVYGNDLAHTLTSLTYKESEIRLPVFGMVYNDSALMGTIIKGEGSASIIAKTGNTDLYYNTINSKIIYRIFTKNNNALYHNRKVNYIYTLTHAKFGVPKYTVKYDFLTGGDASYSGIARRYREYLADTYSMKKKALSAELAIKSYGAIEKKKNFLGISFYKKQSLTTYDQMKEILSDLKNNGVNNIAVQYMGWSGNGVVNRKLPTKANSLSILGGNKKLKSLIEYSNKNNIDLGLDVDLMHFKNSGNGVRIGRDAIKSPNGDTTKLFDYSIVTFAQDKKSMPDYLLSISSIKSVLNKFIKLYDGINNSSVSFSAFGNMVYSNFDGKLGDYRPKTISEMQEIMNIVRKKYESVSITGGNAYAIPYSNRIYEVPVSSSGYDIFSFDVPFYQMVVSGYTSYTTPTIVQSVDYDTMELKAIETGSDLLFDCIYEDASVLRDTSLSGAFSCQYKTWKEKAIKSYKKINEIYEKTEGSNIFEHSIVSDGVYRVTYSNGAEVFVNYNNEEVTINGMIIPERGYLVKED